MFGIEALENMEFQIAKKCFNRVKDCRSLLLINEVEVSNTPSTVRCYALDPQEMKARGRVEDYMRAYVYAYAKRFREAAQLLQDAGAEQSALEMFSDLRMFDQAQALLLNYGIVDKSCSAGVPFQGVFRNAEVTVAEEGRLGAQLQRPPNGSGYAYASN